MKISAWYTDAFQRDMLEGLEWENSERKFSKYHYKTILQHLKYLLDESVQLQVICRVSIDDDMSMIITGRITECGYVQIHVLNFKTGLTYELPEFKIHESFVLPSTLKRFGEC